MNLDLTGLAEVTHSGAGEPLTVPLDLIACDPDQPRKYFDEAPLQELAASIRSVGVVQPVSVRPDPAVAGRYIINYGERRYRAAMIAGLHAIPAFVHKSPDSYTQVAENLHRADLSPMEMALFIKRRLDAGEKRSGIATRLGYKKSYVTEHLALLESPACVEKAYVNGVVSARTLYDLRRLHDEFPEQVDAWCASGAEVTRESIMAFGKKVRHDEQSRDLAHGHAIEADFTERLVQAPKDMASDHLEDSNEAMPKVRHDEQLRASPYSLVPDADALAPMVILPVAATAGLSESSEMAIPGTGSNAAAAGKATARRMREASLAFESPPLLRRVDSTVHTDSSTGRLRVKVRHGIRNATIEDDSVVWIRYEDGDLAEVRLADTVVVSIGAA